MGHGRQYLPCPTHQQISYFKGCVVFVLTMSFETAPRGQGPVSGRQYFLHDGQDRMLKRTVSALRQAGLEKKCPSLATPAPPSPPFHQPLTAAGRRCLSRMADPQLKPRAEVADLVWQPVKLRAGVVAPLELEACVVGLQQLAARQAASATNLRRRATAIRPGIELAELQQGMLRRLRAREACTALAQLPESSAALLARALADAPRPSDAIWSRLQRRMQLNWQ